jgi:hypothetical protein
MNKPIVGVVENMSYLYVAELKKKIELFGKSRGQEMAEAAGAPLIAQIPIDPELAALCDQGEIEKYNSEDVQRLGDFMANTPMGSVSCDTGCSAECGSCNCHCDESHS